MTIKSKRDPYHLRTDPFLRVGNDREKKKRQQRLYCTLYPKCTWHALVKIDPEEWKQKDNDVRFNSAAARRDKHMEAAHNERMPWAI